MALLKKLRVAVIGAGLSGSATAASLLKLGCGSVAVFDRAHNTHQMIKHSTGTLMTANGVRVFDALGLSQPLYKHSNAINQHTQRNTRSDLLSTFYPERSVHGRVASGEPLTNLACPSSTLLSILHAALPKETVRWQHEVSKIEQEEGGRYAIHFAHDEPVYHADLIVGADGIHSSVRENYVSPSKTSSPIRSLNGHFVHGLALGGVVEHQQDELMEIWGNGQRFGCASVHGGQHWWFATVGDDYSNQLSDPKVFSETFKSFPSWVPALIHRTNSDRYAHNQLVDLPPQTMHREGVALVGTAACSLTIDYFQQPAQCVESGLVLALCLLKNEHLNDALDEYQKLRRVRLNNLSNVSHSETESAMKKSKFMSSLRDMASSMMPKNVGDMAWEQAIKYNLFDEFPELNAYQQK